MMSGSDGLTLSWLDLLLVDDQSYQRIVLGSRADMWDVQTSRAKSDEAEEEFELHVNIPKVTELENNRHMRTAYR